MQVKNKIDNRAFRHTLGIEQVLREGIEVDRVNEDIEVGIFLQLVIVATSESNCFLFKKTFQSELIPCLFWNIFNIVNKIRFPGDDIQARAH